MFVLTLKEDAKLHIGDDITLQFVRKVDPARDPVEGRGYSKEISVAIKVPWDVSVAREETIRRPSAYRLCQRKG